MMPRELDGVVDSKLWGYGVQGLRIVDAGIMPLLLSCRMQSTTDAVRSRFTKTDGGAHLQWNPKSPINPSD